MLGFDVGTRRIGVAVGSALGAGARAVAVIDVHGVAVDWNALDRVKRNWLPVGLVVGDPLTLKAMTSRSVNKPMRLRVSYVSAIDYLWYWLTSVPVQLKPQAVSLVPVQLGTSAAAMLTPWMR